MIEDNFNERPKHNSRIESVNFLKEQIVKAEKLGNDDYVNKLEEILRIINNKKYGLVWEEHSEKVKEEMKSKIPVFVEDKSKQINDDKGSEQYNFLLEGDNLHSLHLLEKTHEGKIDFIYIDPPYNTGNKDFKYNDKFIDDSDNFKHSKWLSFMEHRLSIARKLLSDNGVIFISIDNREGYQLKLLLDEIFGENHFAADLHVETSAVAGPRRYAAIKGSVVKTTEFVFAYTKGSNKIMKRLLYDGIKGFDTHYSKFEKEDDGTLISLSDRIKEDPKLVQQFTNAGLKVDMPSLNKLVQVNPIIKNWIHSDSISKHIFRVGDKLNVLDDDKKSMIKADKVTKIGERYTTLNKKGKPIVLFRYFERLGYSDDYSPEYGERTIRGNLWKGFSADGGNLSSEGGVKLKNGKKPIRLIKQLIKSSTCKSSKPVTILDFFAGSGTTGESVMELNSEQEGKYNFILATNDEVIDTTFQRMKNISKRYPFNLKYFKTSFVDKSDFPGTSLEDELIEYVAPLVELEFGVDVSNPGIQIILEEEQLDDLLNENKIVQNSTIFIVPDVFLDNNQKIKLMNLNVTINEIPNYFFGKDMWS
ncbi:hypothetical protein APS55_02565 [Apilactobacillus kunkeei]|uniref:DNA methylase N-4/N-6 domain-containing protein n=1 Tax=Apilactobacillus kunkeei TaxID=148814 RepID=A0AAC8WBF3_9LACO|nr:site-specific DNA-methyltransferase [Apilactobacillus kunkeei]ALJ31178.1 hypothetical protein APS55_02565 [Apilactobacillus kunkeei]KFJ15773.1 hypothetical protein JI66_00530 [Apilactobacillus kunkeei]